MNLRENIRIATFSIRTNILRSLLTMLGIIIGVASVIGIITVGNGGRDYIISMIKEMGNSVVAINVRTNRASSSDYITSDDVKAIKEIPTVQYASPFVMNFGRVSTKQKTGFGFSLSGNEDLEYVMSLKISHGRFFTKEEYNGSANVAIIQDEGARSMFGYENCVGEYIEFINTIDNTSVRLRIIGVSEPNQMMSSEDSGDMSSIMGGEEMSGCALVLPSTVTDKLTGNDGLYETCYISTTSEDELDAAGNAALNTLEARHGNGTSNVYSVANMATYIDLLDSVIRILTTFIAAVSAISLVVGGIGVMNIMLVSVTERTREIGIRKALGAKTRTIMFQFLTESIIMCAIGGFIGFVLGFLGAQAISLYMDIPFKLKLSTILIAIGFSSAIGIFFGIYPARRAAKMPPIEALRRE